MQKLKGGARVARYRPLRIQPCAGVLQQQSLQINQEFSLRLMVELAEPRATISGEGLNNFSPQLPTHGPIEAGEVNLQEPRGNRRVSNEEFPPGRRISPLTAGKDGVESKSLWGHQEVC